MPNYLVYFYTSSSRRNLIQEFIDKQDLSTRSDILEGINLLKEYGLEIMGSKWLKKIHQNPDLFELRVSGKKEVRLLFTFLNQTALVVCHIFVKKSQKLPLHELKLALRRAKEFTSH